MRKLIMAATLALCASVIGITATNAIGNNNSTMGYGPNMMGYNQNSMMNYNSNGMMNGGNYNTMPCGGPYYNQQAQANGAYYCPGYNNGYNQAQNNRYSTNTNR